MKSLVYYFFLALGVAVVMIAIPARTVRFVSPVAPPSSLPSLPRSAPLSPRAEKEKTPMPTPVVKAKPIPITAKPVSVLPAVAAPVPQSSVAMDMPINLRSVVVVKCLFKNSNANAPATAYGSGVIINREGYVMTARHVIDMAYASKITGSKQGLIGYVLDACFIAIPPEGTKTPTFAEIRALNQFTLVTEFAYRAQVALIPPDTSALGMSDAEYNFADSALLRITSAVNGPLPASFVASSLRSTTLPASGDEIVTFGFPSGVPSYGNNFYLQGSVGEIQDVVGGDQLFKDKPMGMTATMETIGGRSGSPVFWRGNVIGVISSKEDYSRNTVIAGVYPLARFAEEAGLAIFK